MRLAEGAAPKLRAASDRNHLDLKLGTFAREDKERKAKGWES